MILISLNAELFTYFQYLAVSIHSVGVGVVTTYQLVLTADLQLSLQLCLQTDLGAELLGSLLDVSFIAFVIRCD